YEQLIADYLAGSLDKPGKDRIEELLATGEIDLIDFRAMEQLHEELDLISVPSPNKEISSRFYQMLENEKAAMKPSWYQKITEQLKQIAEELTLTKLAYAFVLLIIGGFFGAQFSSNSSEIEQLSSEMQELREVMMVNLLEGASATDRLKAVNISAKLPSADNNAIRALLFTLNNDPSVNVRVQSIEALKRWGQEESVREGLVNSITKQESPVVIIELADAMIELELRNSTGEFEQLLEERELDLTVQQKLQNSIAVLM
ncbi:MAG: hypothetical protein WD597_07130, partial [Balneolaceae bacterium]